MAAPVDNNSRTVYCGRSTGNLYQPSQSLGYNTTVPQTPQGADHLNRYGMRQGTPFPDQYLDTVIPFEHSTPLPKGASTRWSKGTSQSLMAGMQKYVPLLLLEK